jgi:hypothetical protein
MRLANASDEVFRQRRCQVLKHLLHERCGGAAGWGRENVCIFPPFWRVSCSLQFRDAQQ